MCREVSKNIISFGLIEEIHSLLVSGNGAQPHDIMALMMESCSGEPLDLDKLVFL